MEMSGRRAAATAVVAARPKRRRKWWVSARRKADPPAGEAEEGPKASRSFQATRSAGVRPHSTLGVRRARGRRRRSR